MIVRLVRVGKNAIRIFVENGTHSLPYQVNHQLSYNVLKAFHFSWRKTIKQIQHAKAVAGDKGITDTEILKKLLAKGKALYNILFPNGIEFLKKQVIFYTDPTIPDLPYEAIAYKGEVLVQNYSIIRQVEIPKRPKINQTSYRESLILTNPNDAADIKDLCNKEKEDLIKLLPNPIHLGKYSEISVVLEKLLQVKYFHYCGHIVKNKIFFQNSVLTPADIESMNLSHLNVVFLNACNSAQHQESSSSFANAFITAGVQNYIGYSIPASEQAARFIAQSFWKKVKKGISLEQAILQIRKEIISHFGIGELSWLGLNAFITFPHQKTLYQKIFSKVKKSMLMLFFPLLFFLLFIPYSQMQNKIEKQTSERKTHKKVGVRTSKQ
ncbi:MAG: CHAT domain-containing protein, partial [Candidatus Hydrogenedentota bacterium]